MTWCMGIDIGGRMIKGVISENRTLKTCHLFPSGFNYRTIVERLKEELLVKGGLLQKDIAYTLYTGQGARVVSSGKEQLTDIRCCVRGMNSFFPSARTIMDIGATSSRVIRINKGEITNYIVSEKCAAGSGYILELVANVLGIEFRDIGPISLKAQNAVAFASRCAVFTESEAISRISEGFSKEDILAGIHKVLANEIFVLANRIGLEEPCAISGGVALDFGQVKVLEEELKLRFLIPPQPQFVTALGAAIIADEIASTRGSPL